MQNSTQVVETNAKERLEQLLAGFESVQTSLVELYGHKDAALRTGNVSRLLELLREEERLAQQLDSLARKRYDLLQQLQRAGWLVRSFEQVVQELERRHMIEPQERARLQHHIQQLNQQTATLRRLGWVHWIVARRIFQHHGQLLQLIEQGGKRSPTYQERETESKGGTPSGVLLDHVV